LAAGKGKRMKSDLGKVLHRAAGRPMIWYVLDAARSLGPEKTVMVVGHQAEAVRETVASGDVEFALQEPILGTGHAVAAARDLFRGFSGQILILSGDVPLITPETLREFSRFHLDRSSRLTVMTMRPENPAGFGRIVRDEAGAVVGIVEDGDAHEDQRAIKEVNTGMYLVEATLLFSLLERIHADNIQGEFYLTDMLHEATKDNVPIHGFELKDPLEAIGVNTRSDLARVSGVLWNRIREDLMESGVTLLDPARVYVDYQVRVGYDTVIHPSVTLAGATEIGRDCVIESGVYITDSKIGNGVHVRLGSRLDHALVQDGASVGPMAHLRPEAVIGKNARIGNFVEIKKTSVGDGSKAAHLTYLGDSFIGKDVNIGCGTITCNYDGKTKHRTTIRDRCFVGSDVQFVAPVEIGAESVIGAGSTITVDVPPRSLAVARAKQKNYPLRKRPEPNSSDEDRKS